MTTCDQVPNRIDGCRREPGHPGVHQIEALAWLGEYHREEQDVSCWDDAWDYLVEQVKAVRAAREALDAATPGIATELAKIRLEVTKSRGRGGAEVLAAMLKVRVSTVSREAAALLEDPTLLHSNAAQLRGIYEPLS